MHAWIISSTNQHGRHDAADAASNRIMSATTPVEFERENGQIRAVDRETGESGTGETKEDAGVDLINHLDNIDDIVRVSVAISSLAGTTKTLRLISVLTEMLNPDLLDDVDIKQEENGWWTATDEETGVTSQGQTQLEALKNLNEAVDGYKGEGREPTSEELREIGIEPEKNVSGEPLPDEFQ